MNDRTDLYGETPTLKIVPRAQPIMISTVKWESVKNTGAGIFDYIYL